MFVKVETRPDIAFATFIVNWFVKNLFCQYIEAIKTIMRYLKTTKLVEITYGREEGGKQNIIVKKYSNFDWAGNYATR